MEIKKILFLGVFISFILASCAVKKAPAPTDLALEGKNFDYYLKQGSLRLDRRDYDEAVDFFTKALSLNPKSARAYNLRGIAYFQKKNFRLAEEQFLAAVALNDTYSEAYNNLAGTYFARREFDKSEEMFRKTLALAPDSISANYGLGTLLLVQGNVKEGTQYLARGIELDPEFLETHKALLVEVSSPAGEMSEVFFTCAELFARKGDVEKTVLFLNKAAQAGFRDWRRISEEEDFAGMREDPRIMDFIRRRPLEK